MGRRLPYSKAWHRELFSKKPSGRPLPRYNEIENELFQNVMNRSMVRQSTSPFTDYATGL
jgi:hypothetical protein